MTATPPVDALLGPLAAALAVGAPEFAGADLHPLADTGLAHHHVRLGGHQVLARIPKQSQMGLAAQDNLAYQAACFGRAGASGHTPRLVGVLGPAVGLPRGALLVEYIEGRRASLPEDLPAIMAALAGIHALPVPEAARRPPLEDPADPLAALDDEISLQARHLDRADIHPHARALIDEDLHRLHALRTSPARPSRRLISFDAHPGNFVMRPTGEAVLVDLEKCRYSYPALDLAHATLYTSTTWEPGDDVALDPAQVVDLLEGWMRQVAAAGGAVDEPDLAWLLPLRRAMWLWSITWCAKWRVRSGQAPATSSDGEDWAAAHSTDALTAHVRDRVDHYLDRATVERITAEFDAPQWNRFAARGSQ